MSKLYRSLLWSGLVAAGVAACGDDVTVTPPAPPPALTVHSISVGPSGVSIPVGSTLPMTASVNADATIATTVTWSVNVASTIATVSSAGVLTAVAVGQVAVQACSTVVTSVCGNATVSIVAASTVTGVVVTPATSNINSVAPGNTQQLGATVSGSGSVSQSVNWTSLSTGIATVSSGGLVTAVSVGTAVIQACAVADATKCGQGSVIVSAATVTSVTVSPSGGNFSRPLLASTTVQLTAAVAGANNPSQLVTWSQPAGTAGILTVSATGLVTITTASTGGLVNVSACSTVANFTTVCGSSAINVLIPTPATLSIGSVTWVPQAPGTCAVGPGPVVPVVLTNVNCQIEVTTNVNAGDQVLNRLDILVGGQVVQSQTFPGTVAPQGDKASVSAPVDITLSVNTRQLRDGTFGKVPVIFNGNQVITANLYVAGTAVPLASNAVPVVMNNLDAFFVTPGVDGPSLLRTLVVAPAPVVSGGATWFKGTETATGTFIAYSNTQPTAFNYTASTVCGGTTPAAAGIANGPTSGLVVTGVFTCGGVEGQNFLGAAPAGVLSYAPAVTGPDGTGLATAATLTYINVGSAYQVPTGPILLPALQNRYNPISLAVIPSGFIDNEGPSVDVASSTTLLFATMAPTGRAVAANISFDQWWISGGAVGPPITAAFAFSNCVLASTKTADPGGVFTLNCGTSGYRAAADGGVGLAAGFPASRVTVVAGAVESCTGATVSSGADLAVTTTSNSNTTVGGGYRICTYAEDLLANPSSTVLAASSAGLVSNGTNKSNVFGDDKLAPLARLAGSTAATPATFGAPLAGTHSPAIVNNTTIFNIASALPTTYWGIEGQDDRAGFNQTAGIALRPADQTITRYNVATPGAGAIPAACSFVAASPQLMPTILSDSWVRANGFSLVDCATGGLGATAGIYEYLGRDWDRANNQSNNLGPFAYWVDLERPNVTGLGFPTNVLTLGFAAAGLNVFSISANDNQTVSDAILQFNYPAANFPTGGETGVAYTFYSPTTGAGFPVVAAPFDIDKWDHIFSNVVNGGPFTLGYYTGRYDETCTGVVTVPWPSCAAGSAGTLPAALTDYPSGAAWQPGNVACAGCTVNANARDAAFNANTAGPGITVPMLTSQSTAAGAASTFWSALNTISWAASIAGSVVTANHTTPSSLTLPYFDEVRLFRLGTVAPYVGKWMECGIITPGSSGVLVFDNGIQRIWRWTFSTPAVASMGNVCVGTAAQGNFAVGGAFRVGGNKSGATLMTPNF